MTTPHSSQILILPFDCRADNIVAPARPQPVQLSNIILRQRGQRLTI
jgi:hypothetical protein